MEEKRPPLPRRPPSFNPEAATFSPTKANAVLWPSAGKHGPTPPTSPQKTAVTPAAAKDESPFRTAPELRPIYELVDDSSRAQPDPGYMPLDLHDLIRALEQAQHEAAKTIFPAMQSIDTPIPYLPPGLFSPQRHESNFNAPEVDELSKTLGLPGVVSKDKTSEEVPVRPHDVSNSDDGADGKLLGKLMEQALDKPLTANALAHYLHSPSASKAITTAHSSRPSRDFGVKLEQMNGRDRGAMEVTAMAHLSPSRHLGMLLEQINGQDLPTRIVQPPPGFHGENPRMIHAEEPQTTSVIPDPKPIPTGPSNFGNARRFSDLHSTNSLQLHNPQYRVPGHRRNTRPRAPTRTKRSDQGPEPSAADIYPDDAVYMPPNGPSSTRRPSFAVRDTHITTLHERTFASPPHLCTQRAVIQDPTSWPTPAEVYAGKPPPSTTKIFTQQPPSPVQAPAAPAPGAVFDLFADHCPPSAADIHEADAQVDALIDFAPYLFALDLSDAIMRDDRPLTSGQKDGSRYGLRFHGIGLGDCWKGAAPAGSDGAAFF